MVYRFYLLMVLVLVVMIKIVYYGLDLFVYKPNLFSGN